MTVSWPVRIVGILYVLALGFAAVTSCDGPSPRRSPVPVVNAFQRHEVRLPFVWRGIQRTAEPSPTPRATPSARDRLIASVQGFARVRSVDGAGTRGRSCVVTSMAAAGGGTLADCLSRDGRWITFAERGRIVLSRDLPVPSNTTIDARGAGVELYGHGLIIARSQNVIVAGLAISGCEEDAVQIAEHAEGVFLTGLVLSRCGDGLVDVTDGATDVTLADSTLRDHAKAMLIGASDAHSSDTVIRVTIANVIFATTYRHPLCRFGYVHLDRVTIGPWVGDAVDARLGCRVLITRSWFVPGGTGAERRAIGLDYGPGASGAARIVDTHLGGRSAQLGGIVADPPYRLNP